MLMREWRELYAAPERPLRPLPPYGFRDVALAERAGQATEAWRASLAWWAARRPDFDPAPRLPLLRRSPAGGRPRFTRRKATLPAGGWEALRGLAARHGLTPSMALCAAFAEVIEAWSSEPGFVLNLTTFRRAPIHPRVWDLAGDFTTMAFLDCRRDEQASFAGFARALQAQLRAQLDHRRVHALDVVRAWSRQGPLEFPVVFTSMVRGDGTAEWHTEWLGEEVCGISQTANVSPETSATVREIPSIAMLPLCTR